MLWTLFSACDARPTATAILPPTPTSTSSIRAATLKSSRSTPTCSMSRSTIRSSSSDRRVPASSSAARFASVRPSPWASPSGALAGSAQASGGARTPAHRPPPLGAQLCQPRRLRSSLRPPVRSACRAPGRAPRRPRPPLVSDSQSLAYPLVQHSPWLARSRLGPGRSA